METTVFLILGLLVLLIIIFLVIAKKAEKKDAIEKEEAIRREQQEREDKWSSKVNDLEEKYGKATLRIYLPNGEKQYDNLLLQLVFFEESSIALVQGEPIPFKNILTYSLTDNQEVITTTSGTAETSTSTGSMVGRALVGGILLGGVGALAGATTANKNTGIDTETSQTTIHDYTIYLNIDSIANPQRIINFGEDGESANKATSVFNIIVNRNNRQ